MMVHCEVHFTEGFTGQKVQLRLDGETHLDTHLQSKFQTGLAHIETLEVEGGQAMALEIEGADAITLIVEPSEPVFIVHRENEQVHVTRQANSPGYL